MRRLVPQWLAALYCSALRHRLREYQAWDRGVLVRVETCLCGGRQKTRVVGANRRLKRAAEFRQ